MSVCRFGITEAPVGGFANCPQGIPVLSADTPANPEIAGVTDHGLGAERAAFLEVLLDARRFVVTAQIGIDSLGQNAGPERTGRAAAHGAVEDERDLVRSAHVEVIANHAFEPGATGLRTVEHAGVGDLELTERELIAVPGLPIARGERGGKLVEPLSEEAVH